MTTGKTPNMGLPQYAHGDHPDFLGEINDAYMKIDLDVSGVKGKCSVNEQAIQSMTEEINALKKLVEEVIEDGK